MRIIVGFLLAVGLQLSVGTAQAAKFKLETLATGLDHPWSIAFLPDGRWLIAEKSGALRVYADGALQSESVAGVPPVYFASQGGLFDVLPAPDFEHSKLLYLSFAHGNRSKNATRVVRAELSGRQLQKLTPVFTASPLKDTPVHYGGRMAWMRDGSLLLTLGDGYNYREEAQGLDNHFGKMVRINPDGSVPQDNPYVDQPGALPEIYSYGHRNPQGLIVDGERGLIYMHEHGPRGGDELNLLAPGKNYGWPAITYGIDYSGAVISPFTEMKGMEQPLTYWVPSIAPSGMAQYRGELFADWTGDLLITALAERSLRRVKLDSAGKVLGQEQLELGINERLRAVSVAPDGAVILLTDGAGGKLLRVTPGGK